MTQKMRIVLVGPGALGCLLASVIARGVLDSGDEFTILDHNSSRADLLTTQGIVYLKDDQRRSISVRVSADPRKIGPADIIIICVKSYNVDDSLTFCTPLFHNGTMVVFLQNGISHLALKNIPADINTAYGTTTEGATLLAAGHVIHAGSGITHLGFLTKPSSRPQQLLQKLRNIFLRGNLNVQLTDDIIVRLWAKLFINIGINALTATLDCKNGELLTITGVQKQMDKAIKEAILVARAKGIPIITPPLQAARTVCLKTADNISSMLQDVRRKRRTEIDAINGAIITLAQEFNIDTPENNRLYQRIKKIEENYSA